MSTPPLTERYVREVVRRIPAEQRDDVADELRATIADTVDGQNSDDPDTAEREVLTEMGDPIRLAARYADRPAGLIGPDIYPTYVRLLTVLLTAVLPVIVAVLAVVDIVDGEDVGTVVVSALGGAVIIGAQMVAWPTLVFALVERSRSGTANTARKWSPDDLPAASKPRRGATSACIAAVVDALLIGLIVWQHSASPDPADGTRLQVLNPTLWSGWIWPILAGLVAIVVLNLVQAVIPSWTVVLAAVYVASEALFAGSLIWVLYQQELFNPAFVAHFNQGTPVPDAFYTACILGVLVISGSSAYSRIREALR